MTTLKITYLNAHDIDALQMTDAEVLAAVEEGLIAQGQGRATIEPRVHLECRPEFEGHFNVLRGYIDGWPGGPERGYAGVKVVSDYYNNYKQGLSSEMALLNLYEPTTGRPLAILDATLITEMRTGALTALGAKHLARKDSKVLGHIGARGTAFWNVKFMDSLFDFEEIRVHSRRAESRDAFGRRLEEALGKKVVVTEDWESCLKDADILVEASRLLKPEPLLKTSWIKKGALVMPYGTNSALELDILDGMDKILMDDWGQARSGKLGALRAHVDQGRLSEENYYSDFCQVATGRAPGRERDDETILFWHRGLSLSDVALGAAMLQKAHGMGVGQSLVYA